MQSPYKPYFRKKPEVFLKPIDAMKHHLYKMLEKKETRWQAGKRLINVYRFATLCRLHGRPDPHTQNKIQVRIVPSSSQLFSHIIRGKSPFPL